MYKIHVGNRNYAEWECFFERDMKPVNLDKLDPVSSKLLSGDVFDVEEDGTVLIKKSPTRKSDIIPGVLDLKSNKTFGREKTGKKRLFYRVVPDDMRLPVFLVPYEQKYMGFSKIFSNVYVLIKFNEWESKHPFGIITATIGSVEELFNFYEYQLYCRSLYASIQRFSKETTKQVRKLSEGDGLNGIINKKAEYLQDRRGDEWNVFTIDPINSVDFDDGFSIKQSDTHIIISVYIANVTILMDHMNLWDSFSTRVATIYLPDRKRPMLPTILSDSLCSLQEKVPRFAMTMDLFIDKQTFEIKDVKYKNCVVKVSKNYRYQEKELMKMSDYVFLEKTVKELSKKYQYIRNIQSSHDVVSYLMTMMNYYCAKNLLENKQGIFRNSALKTDGHEIPKDLPEEIGNFVKIWYSSGGQYVDASLIDSNIVDVVRHELMNMDAYIHITSPIRRLVDLLNMIKFQEINNLIILSESCYSFYKRWTTEEQMNYINTSMRSIRKLQNDCSMLEFYTNNSEVIDKEYNGILFDKVVRHDGMYKYVVYLWELKLTMRIYTPNDYMDFETKKFKLYLFHDEDTLKRKIRLQLVE